MIFTIGILRERLSQHSRSSEVLQAESRKFSTVFVILDALDECPDSQQTRAKVISVLHEIQTVRLIVTGRPHDMMQTFEEAVRLDIRPSDSDIEKYADGQIEMEKNLKKHKEGDELRKTIKDMIVNNANGM